MMISTKFNQLTSQLNFLTSFLIKSDVISAKRCITKRYNNDFTFLPYKMKSYENHYHQFCDEIYNPSSTSLNHHHFGDRIINEEGREKVDLIIKCYDHLKAHRLVPTVPYILQHTDMLFDQSNEFGIFRCIRYLLTLQFSKWRLNKIKEYESMMKREIQAKDQLIEIGCFDRNNQLQYGYFRNTMFSRRFDKGIKKLFSNSLRTADQFGSKVVLDLSFDNLMPEKEIPSAINQIIRIHSLNLYDYKHPFSIHLCNCNLKDRIMTRLQQEMRFQINQGIFKIHQESYLDLFPNEKIVYLSPDANKIMNEFDPGIIYIIGALVGKRGTKNFTFKKARQENIKTMKLPISKYLKLRNGITRTMSYEGVFRVLCEMNKHGDWKTAFTNSFYDHKFDWDDDQDVDDDQSDVDGQDDCQDENDQINLKH